MVHGSPIHTFSTSGGRGVIPGEKRNWVRKSSENTESHPFGHFFGKHLRPKTEKHLSDQPFRAKKFLSDPFGSPFSVFGINFSNHFSLHKWCSGALKTSQRVHSSRGSRGGPRGIPGAFPHAFEALVSLELFYFVWPSLSWNHMIGR